MLKLGVVSRKVSDLTCDNIDVGNILRAQVHGLGVGLESLSQHFLLCFAPAESVEADDVQASLLYLLKVFCECLALPPTDRYIPGCIS